MTGRDVWVLGGSGRSGQAIVEQLLARDVPPVLVGRDAARLAEVSKRCGGARTVVAGSVPAMAEKIREQRPAVVVNTVGPFAVTGSVIAEACTAGSHYIDLANDLAAVPAILAMHERAVAAERIFVTGAGFGVTATESVVVKLCEGRPVPASVRVDAVPSLETQAGPLGDALAGTLLEGLPSVEGGRRYQGRRFQDGKLVAARLAGDVDHLRLPDGSTVTTVSAPLGELIAAQRASGAPAVTAASSEFPTSPVFRAVLPLASVLLTIGPLRRFAERRLAGVQMPARERPRPYSWARAVIRWGDGAVREGWLRAGDAQEFTGIVPAEIARRLLSGPVAPGAGTPGALFGSTLAEACGGEFVLDGTGA